MNCPECQQLLQRRLDGDDLAGEEIALASHLAACPACRSLHAAGQRLLNGLRLSAPIALPADFTSRIVRGVVKARLRRRRLQVATALAAGLLLAVTVGYLRPPVRPIAPEPIPVVEAPASPSLEESMAEARSAVAALTRRTADEALGQTRSLLADMTLPQLETDSRMLEETLEPPARSLREAGQNVAAGLEPVTTSARRAFDLFVRELPAPF